jgi:hypothetical protein
VFVKRLFGAAAVAVSAFVATSALAQTGSVRPARTRIVITPQQGYTVVEPPPTARRYCRSWLAQEARASGTVIVPRMQCWWQ